LSLAPSNSEGVGGGGGEGSGAVRDFYDKAWTGEAATEARYIAGVRREALSYAFAAVETAFDHARASNERPRLLEIGPGPGDAARRFAARGADVVGVDLSATALAALRGTARPCQGDAGRLPFRSGCFPVVFANSMLMFLPLERSLPEIARVTAKDGAVVILEPLDGNPFMRAYRRLRPRYAGIAKWHTYDALLESARRQFASVEIVPFYGFVPVTLLPGALRFLERIDRAILRLNPRAAWMVAISCRSPR
jgi:SAM-dependent methyltransferase